MTTGLNAMAERFLITYCREWVPGPAWGGVSHPPMCGSWRVNRSWLCQHKCQPGWWSHAPGTTHCKVGSRRVNGSRNYKTVNVTRWECREAEVKERCGLWGGWRENSSARPDKAKFHETFSFFKDSKAFKQKRVLFRNLTLWIQGAQAGLILNAFCDKRAWLPLRWGKIQKDLPNSGGTMGPNTNLDASLSRILNSSKRLFSHSFWTIKCDYLQGGSCQQIQ